MKATLIGWGEQSGGKEKAKGRKNSGPRVRGLQRLEGNELEGRYTGTSNEVASSPWGMKQGQGLQSQSQSQKGAQETYTLMNSANGCFLKAACVPCTDPGMGGNKRDKVSVLMMFTFCLGGLGNK